MHKRKNNHREPTKVFVHLFQKVVGRRGKAPLALRRGRNTYLFNKDQEGSPNSPVDCWGVGNPIKGFPDGPHRGPFFLCPLLFCFRD